MINTKYGQLRHIMFDYHNLTLKEGFEVTSRATKLSKLMYDIVLDVYILQKIASQMPKPHSLEESEKHNEIVRNFKVWSCQQPILKI